MLIESELSAIYTAIRALIINPSSYTQAVKMENVIRYIDFVEYALYRPYNRVCHLTAFIGDMDGLLTARMYPFCFLEDRVKVKVNKCYLHMEQLITEADNKGGFDKETHLLG